MTDHARRCWKIDRAASFICSSRAARLAVPGEAGTSFRRPVQGLNSAASDVHYLSDALIRALGGDRPKGEA
jgi:hypothetical protein